MSLRPTLFAAPLYFVAPFCFAVPVAAELPSFPSVPVRDSAPAEDTSNDGGDESADKGSDGSGDGDIVVLGNRATKVQRGIGSDLATERLSQSSRAIAADLVRDYGAVRLNDALELVSGISRQNNLGGLRDNFAIRGFLGTPDTGAEYYVDGFLANRGFGPPRDPALVERIEVLKGPAGALFGEIDPAGRINIVQKAPSFTPDGYAALTYGSFDTARIEVDATGPLSKTIAGRIVVAVERSDGYRDFVDLRRSVVSPSLTWAPSAATRMTYTGEWLRFASPFDRGVPALNGNAEAVARDRFYGEPADGRMVSRNMRQQLVVTQDLGDDWTLNGGAAWRKGRLTGFSSEPSRLVAGPALWRQRRYRDFAVEDLSGRLELAGRIDGLGGVHRPTLGIKGYVLDFTEQQWRRSPSATLPYQIDVTRPVYGTTTAPLLPFTDQKEHREAITLYAQDMWEIGDRLTLNGGMRYDRWTQRYDNRRNFNVARVSHRPFDGRVAARYRVNDTIAVHASYGESFRANSSTGRDGAAFAPERGHGWETGIAARGPGIDATVTYFSIEKTNILATDPIDANFLAPIGQLASRGIELDASVTLPRGWRLVGNYAWVHARSDDRAFSTTAVLNVPEHQATAFVSGPLFARLRANAGVTYQSRRAATIDASRLQLPAYTKVRMAADYAITDRIGVRGEIDNVFDTSYADSSYSALWIAPGAGRTVRATLTVRS